MFRYIYFFSFFILLNMNSAFCANGIYLKRDKTGQLILTDKPVGKDYEAYIIYHNQKFSRDYIYSIIMRYCQIYGVDESLVKAIVKVESNFNHQAVSAAGAQGLMQLIPSTGATMNLTKPFDPDENIRAGVRYLRAMLIKFHNNVPFAVAAYNAGPSNVEKYKGIPPFKETQNYVVSVIGYYYKFQGE